MYLWLVTAKVACTVLVVYYDILRMAPCQLPSSMHSGQTDG